MASWNRALKEGLLVGSVASVLSTLTLAAMGRRETGHAAAPANAVSDWLWRWRGESIRATEPDLRYALTDYLIHHATSVFWAMLYSRTYGQRPNAKTAAHALPASAMASALACFVDHQLNPKRLQSGFEKRRPTTEMVAMYGSFAIGLAAGNLLLAEREKQAQAGERRRAPDRRQRPRRSNEIAAPDRRRWRAGQPALMSEGTQAWPWPERSSGSGDGGTGESWSANVTSR